MARLALAVLLASAAGAVAADPPSARQKSDAAIEARRVLKKYCAECHTSGGAGHKAFAVLDHAGFMAADVPVPFANKAAPSGSLILHLLEDGSMPPGGKPRPSKDEVAAVRAWIGTGAAGYPASFGEASVLDEIVRHEATKVPTPAEAAGYRYVSFRHLFADDAPAPPMGDLEPAFKKALFAAAGTTNFPVDPIDDLGTIYRIDAGKIGWTAPDLFDRVTAGKADGSADFNGFDLILLEYPFVGPPPAAAKDFLAKRKQVRPVPFLRGDWLTAALLVKSDAGKDEPTPLALDLKTVFRLSQFPDAPPSGPKLRAKPFAETLSRPLAADIRAGKEYPLVSGMSVGDITPDAAPFELSFRFSVTGNPAPALDVTTRDIFRIEVKPTRDVFVECVWVQSDGECVVQPLKVNRAETDKFLTLLPPAENRGFKVASILTGADTATEHVVLFASEKPMPLFEIVRSRHKEEIAKGDARIWRFVTPYPLVPAGERDPLDASKVVRRIIPVKVRAK
jgi:mono/diheme cytochrome c family protein